MRLAELAGGVGENDEDPGTLFVRFRELSYTREEVLELLRIMAEIQPDECTIENGGYELRLWWD